MHPRLHPDEILVQRESPGWNDHAVWCEFREGSELAFTAIYKRYVYDLYHFGERLTSNKIVIEDSIHDFFVELWNRRMYYGDVSNLKAYLFKGFKYRLLKNISKSRRLSLLDHEHEYNIPIVLSKEAELILGQISDIQKESILKAINTLSKREKEIITLRFYDGLSFQEIAEVMSLSVKSVYKLLYRAVATLKRYLACLNNFYIMVLAIAEAWF